MENNIRGAGNSIYLGLSPALPSLFLSLTVSLPFSLSLSNLLAVGPLPPFVFFPSLALLPPAHAYTPSLLYLPPVVHRRTVAEPGGWSEQQPTVPPKPRIYIGGRESRAPAAVLRDLVRSDRAPPGYPRFYPAPFFAPSNRSFYGGPRTAVTDSSDRAGLSPGCRRLFAERAESRSLIKPRRDTSDVARVAPSAEYLLDSPRVVYVQWCRRVLSRVGLLPYPRPLRAMDGGLT